MQFYIVYKLNRTTQGHIYQSEGRFQEALDSYNETLLYVNDRYASIGRALCLMKVSGSFFQKKLIFYFNEIYFLQMGYLQQALFDCETAFSMTGANDADAYRARGIIYMKMDRVDKAIVDFKHAVAIQNSEGNTFSCI